MNISSVAPVRPSTARLTALPISSVIIDGGFWGERQELNSSAIIPHAAG